LTPRIGPDHKPQTTIQAPTTTHFYLQLCAIININVAVVNILPLPGLDGGYMVLLFLEVRPF
jgi:membrane-associated protease RseP (regulator of RpoE activity)